MVSPLSTPFAQTRIKVDVVGNPWSPVTKGFDGRTVDWAGIPAFVVSTNPQNRCSCSILFVVFLAVFFMSVFFSVVVVFICFCLGFLTVSVVVLFVVVSMSFLFLFKSARN